MCVHLCLNQLKKDLCTDYRKVGRYVGQEEELIFVMHVPILIFGLRGPSSIMYADEFT